MTGSRAGVPGAGPAARHPPWSPVEEGTDMSVNPEATGEPPEQADEYLKDANAEDPRSDPQAPAHEPAGSQAPDDDSGGRGTPE
jgi:hypothetical protein